MGFKDNRHYFDGQGCMVAKDCQVVVSITKFKDCTHRDCIDEVAWIVGADTLKGTYNNVIQMALTKEKWFISRNSYIPFHTLEPRAGKPKPIFVLCTPCINDAEAKINGLLISPQFNVVTDRISRQQFQVFRWRTKVKGNVTKTTDSGTVETLWQTDFFEDRVYYGLRHIRQMMAKPDGALIQKNYIRNIGLNESGMNLWGPRFWRKDSEDITTISTKTTMAQDMPWSRVNKPARKWLWPVIIVVILAALAMIGALAYFISRNQREEIKKRKSDDEPIILFKNADTKTTVYDE